MKYNYFRFANIAVVCACAILMFACGMGDDTNTNPNEEPEEEVGDDNSNTPNEEPEVDLSYIYVLSNTEQVEQYRYDGSVWKAPEIKRIYTYDGHKVIKREGYMDGNLQATEYFNYDGLTATVTDNNGELVRIIEYADDTYLREKNNRNADGSRTECVYDGAKLISVKSYDHDNKLRHDRVYVYNGLTAKIVANDYGDDGTLNQTTYVTDTYLDETFLRLVSEEVRENNYDSDDYRIISFVYDGTKIIMAEEKYVLSNGEEWVYHREEREYDGLKCRVKEITYDRDGSKRESRTRDILYLE